jgi:hypothetical protein
VVLAVAAGVFILVAGMLALGGGGDPAASSRPPGSTPDDEFPLSAIGATTSTLYIATTSTAKPVVCDSKTSSKGSGGAGYTPCGGGFVVNFPAKPEIQDRSEELPSGSIRYTMYTSTFPDVQNEKLVRFSAVWGDLPPGSTPDDVQKALQGAAFQYNAKPGPATNFQGMDGITFDGVDQLFAVKGMAFSDGSKVWALAILSTSPPEGELDFFASSFKLNPETAQTSTTTSTTTGP